MQTIEREAPTLDRPAWAQLTRAGDGLWRVSDQRGRPLGHLRAVPTPDRWRYRAERYHGPARSFRELGEFWAASDAFDCLRYQR
ncbi:hypothetical protein ACFXP7_09085 [Microbacterium sp. P06]|uniref:hypothetical protein n=1 Tax=Microbacterium sp. P06 TaxID=3366949 RepID=UPI003747268F